MKKILIITAASALAVLIGGCGPFWVDPYITVEESSLNWVHIHYYNLSRKPIRRVSVEIRGNGMVEVKRGTSELVSNDFAKRYRESEWKDIRSSRISIDPKAANDIFQELVNHGVLDREKNGKSSGKSDFKRFIAVKANLCNNTYSDNVNIFEEDPDLAEVLLDVIREFDSPAR